MKDKDVKKMLSEGAAQVLPGEEVKRGIKYRIGADDEQTVTVGGGTKAMRGKKPLIIAAVFAAVIAVLCAVLIPYYLKNRGTSPSNPSIIDKISTIDSADDFYVYSAASVGALLSAQEQSGTTIVKGTVNSTAKSVVKSSSYTIDQISALLDEYMPFVEGLIGGGEITADSTAEIDEKYSAYAYSVTIGYPHIDGGYSTYVLYYNRTLSEVKSDGRETEEKYDIDGVLCVGGVDYTVKGKYEYESEGGETEEEVTFTVYDGGLPYITLKQETEQEADESELGYVYTFYADGRVSKTVEVEYEVEYGETELSLTVEEGNNEYEFKFFLNGAAAMTVKAELNDEKYTVYVTIVDEKYYYSF